MRNFIFIVVITSLLLLTESCSKEKTCSKVSEGLYQGWFTNDDSNNSIYNSSLYLTVVDESTIIINISGNNSSSNSHIQRSGCHVEGKMVAMIGTQSKTLDIVGEISHKKGDYIISGNYFYIEYSSGLGNPNPQYWEVKGTFEIKSN